MLDDALLEDSLLAEDSDFAGFESDFDSDFESDFDESLLDPDSDFEDDPTSAAEDFARLSVR